MINLRRVAASCVAVALGSFMMFSCVQDELDSTPQNEIPQDILTGFADLGYDTETLVPFVMENPLDGSVTNGLMLEGDIFMSFAQATEMTDLANEILTGPQQEKYRTNNLVSQNRTISVTGWTGSGNALTSRMRTGLRRAVNNFNALNLTLNFTLAFGTNINADMVVFNNNQGGGGGSAGFPSGGNPNKFIQINAGTNSFSADVNEHVITHEMGHSVGLRHTDFFNRSLSCGTGGNEGDGGVGAILIPGTPSGNDASSIMVACFSSNEDGEFNGNDRTALRFLY